jgi:hypothetical protein
MQRPNALLNLLAVCAEFGKRHRQKPVMKNGISAILTTTECAFINSFECVVYFPDDPRLIGNTLSTQMFVMIRHRKIRCIPAAADRVLQFAGLQRPDQVLGIVSQFFTALNE